MHKAFCKFIFLFCFPCLLYATTTSTNMNVSANVTGTCNVNASNLNFGNYDAVSGNLDQNTQISLSCTSGLPYTVGINFGSHGGSLVSRVMEDASNNHLNYNLFEDASRLTVWGTTTPNIVASVGTGATQNFTVFGRITGSQFVPAGNYTDVVSVTVTY